MLDISGIYEDKIYENNREVWEIQAVQGRLLICWCNQDYSMQRRDFIQFHSAAWIKEISAGQTLLKLRKVKGT